MPVRCSSYAAPPPLCAAPRHCQLCCRCRCRRADVSLLLLLAAAAAAAAMLRDSSSPYGALPPCHARSYDAAAADTPPRLSLILFFFFFSPRLLAMLLPDAMLLRCQFAVIHAAFTPRMLRCAAYVIRCCYLQQLLSQRQDVSAAVRHAIHIQRLPLPPFSRFMMPYFTWPCQ